MVGQQLRDARGEHLVAGLFAVGEQSPRLFHAHGFVFVNRIQWGVYSILAQLGATGNWHSIHREYLYGDAPRTELGAA